MENEIVGSAAQAGTEGSAPSGGGSEGLSSGMADDAASQAARPGEPGDGIDPRLRDRDRAQGARGPEGERPRAAASRIQQLVAQREYWKGVAEGRARAGAGNGEQPAVPSGARPPALRGGAPVPPNPADFGRWDDYEQARARYSVDRAKFELRHEAALRRVVEAHNEATRAFGARMEEAVQNDSGLIDIMRDPTLRVSPVMALAIRDSAAGPRLIRHLGDHRDEAARIAALPPLAAVRELGKIEARLLASTEGGGARTGGSRAPQPARVVGGTRGSMDADLDRMSIDDFVSRRNRAQYGPTPAHRP